MKKISILALLLVVVGIVAVRANTLIEPSKKNATQIFNLSNFDELKASGIYAVEYEQTSSNTWGVEITAPENIISYIKVSKSRDCLVLSLNKGLSIKGDCKIKAKIKAPALKEIDMSGVTSFKADKINLAGRKFEADMSGASSLDIKSITAAKVELELSGASKTKFGNVSAQKIETEVSGAAHAKMSNVKSSEVEVEASGASNVELSGKADYVDFDASGASKINAKALSADQGKIEASGTSHLVAKIANVLSQRASGVSSIKNEK